MAGGGKRRSRRGTSGDGARSSQRSASGRVVEAATDASGAVGDPVAIVGVVASAGGLDAFKRFLGALPADSGLGVVLVPHLDPDHKSIMAELLGRHTTLPVSEAKNEELIAPNRVYVIPPNRDLHIEGGRLMLELPKERHRATTAIDGWLRSLARDQGEHAIGIILSGTGSHGVLGTRELKLAGGMVMAQDPSTAEYDAMPRSSIATGLVDYVLAPEAMPAALLRYIAQPYLRDRAATTEEAASDYLTKVLAVVRARTKYDFRWYRKSMLLRRVQRRMGLAHVASPEEYLERMQEDAGEITSLCNDLLIGVTAFFREPAAFEILRQRVFPDLIHGRSADTPVRVWIPGCATGEEAYSVAIVLIEAFSMAGPPIQLQIFATDIDENALETGRQGIYPDSIAADVSAERLARFFIRHDDSHYQVNKQLREAVIFAPQNLISDAPFSRLDLVSCRNVLIYLDPEVQHKVVSLFHFALREGGCLLLGPSETIGPHVDMFEPVSRKWRVYRRIGPVRRDLIEIPIQTGDDHYRPRLHAPSATPSPPARYAELTQKLLLETFAPAAVLINRRYEILYFHGPTSRYLELPTGEPTRDLVLMARQGLRTRVRAGCHRAIRDGERIVDAEARVKRNGSFVPCTVTIQPIHEPSDADGLLLVVFEDRAAPGDAIELEPGAPDESAVVRQLEYELRVTSDDLRSTIEELESSNEELKASNEEVMSINEELQSANEELETSKEELQSLNEELTTVNSQLQEKIEELERISNDITNLLHSTDIATVFLDRTLRIKRYTPSIAALFGLLPMDIGRPFEDLAPRVIDDALIGDCKQVLERLTPIEREVRSRDGHHFLRRILPYRTADSRIDGVVITLIDIDERIQAEGRDRLLATVLQNTSDAVLVHDARGQITAWNRGAERMYGYSEAAALGMNIRDLATRERRHETEAFLERAVQGETIEGFETRRVAADGRVLDVSITMTVLPGLAGRPVAIATAERDITELRLADARKGEAERLHRLVEHLPAGAVYIEGDHLEMNRAAEQITGYSRDEVRSVDEWFTTLHGGDRTTVRQLFRGDLETGYPVTRTVDVTRRDGTVRTVEFAGYAFEDGNIWVLQDVTDRRRAEADLRDSEARLRATFDTALDAILTVNARGRIEGINNSGERMFGQTRTELRGREIASILPAFREWAPADYVAQITPADTDFGRGGIEMLATRPDGTTLPVELTISEVRDPDRHFFTAFVRDVSARRSLESRMARIALDERYKLARDLHDGLGSHLAGISMLTEALRRNLERNALPATHKAAELAQSIQTCREELRRIAHGLLPLEISEHGLPGALEELADQIRRTHDINCECSYDERVRVNDPADAAQLFRIVQEAVNNAVQHARPSKIRVVITALGEGLELRIEDDGEGLDPGRDATGRGIAIMRERARLLNATFDMRTRPDGGTVVTCACAALPAASGEENDT